MAEEVALNIELDAGNAPKTLGELRKQIVDLNNELESVALNSDAFDKLSNELRGAT